MEASHNCLVDFRCRACGSERVDSLLRLEGFPKAAQFFLRSLDDDPEDRKVTLRVVGCQSCGLVQLTNSPVPYYRDVITAAALSAKSKEALISEWTPLLSQYKLAGKKAIEIGACRGDFVSVLTQLGMQTCGLEHSSASVAIARERGLDVREGYLPTTALDNKFDLVVCNNYLEHQPDIKIFVKKIHELLADEGVVYVSVPNLDYILNRSCLYEFVADHLVYFRDQPLRNLFESNGFAILKQYKKNNDNDLVLVAQKAPTLTFHEHEKTVSKVIASLQSLLVQAAASGKTVASWGAGHRALALLALANAKTISFVVDSAAFKQNLLTPITHIPIKSPEYLMQQGCDILIIMLPGTLALQVKEQVEALNSSCRVVIFDDSEIKIDVVKEVSNGHN
jgi:SAM-dependent methyltransferase